MNGLTENILSHALLALRSTHGVVTSEEAITLEPGQSVERPLDCIAYGVEVDHTMATTTLLYVGNQPISRETGGYPRCCGIGLDFIGNIRFTAGDTAVTFWFSKIQMVPKT